MRYREPVVDTEDQLLTRIALETELAKLPEADRVMMLMIYKIEIPSDYARFADEFPVTYGSIGKYIGGKYETQALSEAAIRYRRDVIIGQMRRERGPLRRRTP